jgi:hypothetical protein
MAAEIALAIFPTNYNVSSETCEVLAGRVAVAHCSSFVPFSCSILVLGLIKHYEGFQIGV